MRRVCMIFVRFCLKHLFTYSRFYAIIYLTMLHFQQYKYLPVYPINYKLPQIKIQSLTETEPKNNMKAIISNGKRNQIFSNAIQYDELVKFIQQRFPGMKNPNLQYKDTEGNLCDIVSQEDVCMLVGKNQGQNFVEIFVVRSCGKDKKEKKQGHGQKNQRKITVLSKIYGGLKQDYEQFVNENPDVPAGKLIKLYAQKHNILHEKKQKEHKKGECKEINAEKRNKIFLKVFGNSQSNEKFIADNKDLKLGQLIKKYKEEKSQVNCVKEENFEKKKKAKLEKLSKFLNRPEEEFVDLVEQNSELNFCQLLAILSESGVEVNRNKLHEFKQEFKKQKQEQRNKRRQQKQSERLKISNKEKPEKPSKSIENKDQKQKSAKKARRNEEKSQNKTQNQTQVQVQREEKIKIQSENWRADIKKGQILKNMRQLFGAQNMKQYLEFINQNIELGEEGIIQKWLQKQ